MPTVHVVGYIEEVHRSTLALGASIDASEEFGHSDLGIQTTGQCMAMIPVGGDDGIVGLERGD